MRLSCWMAIFQKFPVLEIIEFLVNSWWFFYIYKTMFTDLRYCNACVSTCMLSFVFVIMCGRFEWNPIQSNLYIKATLGNMKMWPLWAVALYIQVKLSALFIDGENETALYRQWFVILRYPLRHVWLYIKVCYCLFMSVLSLETHQSRGGLGSH